MSQYGKDKTYLDENGWTQRSPISDDECILKCLKNARYLAGLDRLQVEKLIKQYGGDVM